MNVENAVLERYSAGAQNRVEELCCPVAYDSSLLTLLPREIIDRDYGCGDPSRYVQQGDVVLDLGSGSGKICYMAAQLVGADGRVIGIDINNEMLALARKYQDEMAAKLGGNRVEFHQGQIQDLALDMAAMDAWLLDNPVTDGAGLAAFQQWQREQRQSAPLIPDNSVDLVISNCVLNLVNDDLKRQMVEEIFRVVKPGGRIAIADIISDGPVPRSLKDDENLWSGCISGAFQELEMLQVFRQAGFQALYYDKWADEPWRVIDGIEFRSVTVTALKPETTADLDGGRAVIYKGPYRVVVDDAGHEFPRGERMAVSNSTYRLLMQGPYREQFIGIEPAAELEPLPWRAPAGTRRPATETRGARHNNNRNSGSSCC